MRIIALILVMATFLVSTVAQAMEEKHMSTQPKKTLRLLMPQWQGGDYDLPPSTRELYPLGAHLLTFLAPKSDAPLIEVPITPYREVAGTKQNGVVQQDIVLQQLRAARKIIDEHSPDRIIMFGGDCLVDQAPFTYLNERYEGNIGILWIDAHPDISTPKEHDREHAMILGNLLGGGDPTFTKEVKRHFRANQVLVVGVSSYNTPAEEKIVTDLGLQVLPPESIFENSEVVLRWIQTNKFDNIAIHFDIDALDPKYFYSQFPRNPNGLPFDTALGKLTIAQVTRLVNDISKHATIVGFGFAEHMPWDAYNLKNMMEQFSFMK